MTIQQLQYFTDVAETLNFTKVANKLHISQPNLSHAIFSLEQELGFQLFIRQRGKRTELTSNGRAFYNYVKTALDILEEGIKVLQLSTETQKKTVRVAYSHVYGLVIVPTVVGMFKNQFVEEDAPHVQFKVIHAKEDFVELVRNDTVDAAFSFSPGTAEISAVSVASIELKVMMSKNNPLTEKPVITIEDIAEEPLLCCDQEPFLYEHVLRIFKEHGIRPNIKEIFPDWGPQFANISYNSGVAITPLFPMATDRIVIRDFDDPLKHISYNFLYNKAGIASNKITKKLLKAAMTFSENNNIKA